MSTKPELKPCPFCGSTSPKTYCDIGDGRGDTGIAVVCESNCCCGPVRQDKEAAEQAWNQREKA